MKNGYFDISVSATKMKVGRVTNERVLPEFYIYPKTERNMTSYQTMFIVKFITIWNT